MLSSGGSHVPAIPSREVVGNGASASPEQIGATCVNVGGTFGTIVIVRVVVNAQTPAEGVNVYVVVVVLSKAGDHVPASPSFEVVGRGDKVPPEQIGVTASKVGIALGFTVIV